MGRHLPPGRRGVLGRADGLAQHVGGRDAEGEDEREVAVVGEEPVVRWAQVAGEPDAERLVPGARDLEVHAALLLQGDLAVVDRSRGAHQAEVVDQLGRVELVHRLGPGHDVAPPPASARIVSALSSADQSRVSNSSRTRARNAAA